MLPAYSSSVVLHVRIKPSRASAITSFDKVSGFPSVSGGATTDEKIKRCS